MGVVTMTAVGEGKVWRRPTAAERRAARGHCMVTGLCGLRHTWDVQCGQSVYGDEPYCYYHHKLLTGEIAGHFIKLTNGVYRPASAREVYPVWPLPCTGYVLIDEEE